MAYAALTTIQTLNTGDVLTAACMVQVNDNGEFLIDPPAASVYNSAVQVVSTSTAATLLADSENFDNDSIHSTSTNTGRLTAQTAGRYLAFTTVRFEADADGARRIDFRVDGTTSTTVFNIPAGSAVSDVVVTAQKAFVLSAAQYIECRVIHTAGNDIDVTLEEFGMTFLTR